MAGDGRRPEIARYSREDGRGHGRGWLGNGGGAWLAGWPDGDGCVGMDVPDFAKCAKVDLYYDIYIYIHQSEYMNIQNPECCLRNKRGAKQNK